MLIVWIDCPEEAFHNLIVPSIDDEVMYRPLPLEMIDTAEMVRVCPLRTLAGAIRDATVIGEDGGDAGRIEMLKSDDAASRTRDEGKNRKAVIVDTWLVDFEYGVHCTRCGS